jgi:hypothetical protein
MFSQVVEASIRELAKAVHSEIDSIQKDPSRSFEIREGRLLHEESSKSLYSFRAELNIPILPETPVRVLVKGRDTVEGRLIAQEEMEVLLETDDPLGDPVPEARISSEPWFILEHLRTRLLNALSEDKGGQGAPSEAERMDPGIPDFLLGRTFPTRADIEAAHSADVLLRMLDEQSVMPNDSQRIALSRCAIDPLHFIWGLPGTGKTASLAQVARMLHERNERVLVLSHTNAAVDVAVLRVASAFADTPALLGGRVLRYGSAQMPEVHSHQLINPNHVIERMYPDLIARKKALDQARRELVRRIQAAPSDQRAELATKLHDIREQLENVQRSITEVTRKLVSEATVLGTTLSRLAIDDLIWTWQPDAILIDEISMANFSFVMAAGLVAKRRLLLFGDFRQLPPIFASKDDHAARWLGRDAFAVAQVVDTIDKGEEDDRVTLLRTQYRMAPEISRTVNSFAYNGRLHDGPGLEERSRRWMALSPGEGRSVVLVDTMDLGVACFQDPRPGSFSRINPLHLLLGLDLAEAIYQDGFENIALITPYAAQARLYASATFQVSRDSSLRAATVHRFQGAERDVVIVDLVDALHQKGASRLTGNDPDTALRLLNVALSRARGKVIILADTRFLLERHPAHSPSRHLLRLIEEHGLRVTPESGPREGAPRFADILWYENWEDVQTDLSGEIASAEHSVYVNVPDGFSILKPLRGALFSVEQASGIVFGSAEITMGLEESELDLRLMPRPGGFFALIDDRRAYLGGFRSDARLGRIEHPLFVERLTESLMGSVLETPQPDAATEETLDELCGRCPECGVFRRPVLRKRWGLGCSQRTHGIEPLSPEMFTYIVNASGLRCPDCGGSGIVRSAMTGAFIGCVNFSTGCRGRFPELVALFGRP